MKIKTLCCCLLSLLLFSIGPAISAQNNEGQNKSKNKKSDEGFKSIFDGKSLNGWRGDESLWRVENGAIVGETTDEKKLVANQFLVWDQGEVDDFVLKTKFRI